MLGYTAGPLTYTSAHFVYCDELIAYDHADRRRVQAS